MGLCDTVNGKPYPGGDMKQLMNHARQLNQRRMSAFYFLPHPAGSGPGPSSGQLPLKNVGQTEDRPRSRREMFADTEYDDDEDLS